MTKQNWHQFYPQGVPHEINPDLHGTIPDFFEQSCKKFGDKPCFTNLGCTLSFNEIERLSGHFASYLQHVAGLKKGDRIAIQMPNLLQYPIALFGALRAGLIVVNTNPLYTPTEMKHQFNDSGAIAIVILSNFAKHLQDVLPETKIKTVIVSDLADAVSSPLKRHLVNAVVKYVKKMVPAYELPNAVPFRTAMALGAKKSFVKPQMTNQEVAFLQYTGGTTGVSKGAMLTHRNIVSNMMQISEWMRPLLKEGSEVVITALPLYHIFSLTVNSLTFMNYGGHNILITNPRDIPAFVKEISKYKFTVITGVNTLFNALLNNDAFNQLDFSSLKISVGGAMALQKPVVDRWEARTKTKLIEGYGMTETSPVTVCNPVMGTMRVGYIGIPVPSTQIKIVDEDGKEVPVGTAGELCSKGPQVMKGYWQRKDETDQVLKDGWMHTGDIGQFDQDGYLKLVDRKKDMIIVSGFKVFPNEVEEVVATHPKVLEVAAIGIPDEKSGEAVKIFVVKKDESLSKDDLISHCKTALVNYKVPKLVEFRTELPKTNVGKILRRALR